MSEKGLADKVRETQVWKSIFRHGPPDNARNRAAVVAGNGLTGGASSGSATLNIGAGTGITVAADTISTTLGTTVSSGEVDFNYAGSSSKGGSANNAFACSCSINR